jgi:hypothetical protein
MHLSAISLQAQIRRYLTIKRFSKVKNRLLIIRKEERERLERIKRIRDLERELLLMKSFNNRSENEKLSYGQFNAFRKNVSAKKIQRVWRSKLESLYGSLDDNNNNGNGNNNGDNGIGRRTASRFKFRYNKDVGSRRAEPDTGDGKTNKVID